MPGRNAARTTRNGGLARRELGDRLRAVAFVALLAVSSCGWGEAEGRSPDAVRSIAPPTSEAAAVAESPSMAAHLDRVRGRLPHGRFTIVPSPPFVVIGDEPPDTVRGRASGTVAWAVRMLKQDYFANDPPEIIDIWLFKNADSYGRHVRKLTGHEPDTPFGFYSEGDKAIMTNIETGGGTLVHEIVHPFIAANVPDCPPWFNEGLASLYEQSEEVDGHIHGLVNWRLAGLQEAIGRNEVPPFETLLTMDENGFYDSDKRTNYSQARYLCYYLQQKGQLIAFYKEMASHRKDDPTGLKSLKKILGQEDLPAFKKRWERFVLDLARPT
jgi:hypothetical protein